MQLVGSLLLYIDPNRFTSTVAIVGFCNCPSLIFGVRYSPISLTPAFATCAQYTVTRGQPIERLAYHNVHGAERVKPGLEEIDLILP